MATPGRLTQRSISTEMPPSSTTANGRHVSAPRPYERELAVAIDAVTDAGRLVSDFYDRGATVTHTKQDGSSVTEADLASDQLLRRRLAAHFPDDPILTEEGMDDPARLASARCWIADPMDGTDQFIRRTGDFDVLLALVVAGRPVVAAGLNPPTGFLCAAAMGDGAWIRDQEQSELRPCKLDEELAPEPIRVATSIWFGAPENRHLIERIAQRVGAASVKTVNIGFSPRILLASSGIDAYLGIRAEESQAMGWEWDFATADLFIREAGGMVSDLSGEPHRYNKPTPRSLNGLIAARNPRTHQGLVEAVQAERADHPAARS